MPKKRKQPRKPRHLRAVPSSQSEPDLMRSVRTALQGHPLDLLGLASTMLTLLDAREEGPFRAPREIDRANLIESFVETRVVETTGLLTAFAELCGEDLMAAQIRQELDRRTHPLPGWLTRLDEARPLDRAIALIDPLGDGDNVMIATRLADGRELTAVVYIEHNLGGLVKDAFVVPEALDAVVAHMRRLSEDPDVTFADLAPADARARITDAIRIAAMTVPPFETETWPGSRRLIEWMVAKLPEGGVGYEIPEWTEQQKQALADRFFASEHATGISGPVQRDALDHLLWFGTSFSTGDALHWSPISVEILLLDWIPRKIADSPARLAVVPEVLRAFVRFCHAERGIRPRLTDTVLDVIGEYEPLYLDAISSPRLQGPAALLARMGALDPEAEDEFLFDPDDPLAWEDDEDLSDEEYLADLAEIMLAHLRRVVGGDAALNELDDAPLPDEPFEWDAVPVDVHERVREVLALTDACCDDLLDEQYRTAIRRLLADVAAGDPAIFRRRSRTETAAAALCYIAGCANALFGASLFRTSIAMPKLTYVKDLYAYFGLSPSFSAGQRAEPMLRAIGVDPYLQDRSELGRVRYLTGQRRAELVELRDRYRNLET